MKKDLISILEIPKESVLDAKDIVNIYFMLEEKGIVVSEIWQNSEVIRFMGDKSKIEDMQFIKSILNESGLSR
ncbi:MAG: hypothetical protein E7172_02550 [Firmicutes bacterium]|nr:hypothetical protein [Bacillota bacterium]